MKTQLTASSRLIVPAYRHIQDINLIIRLEGRGNYTLVYVKDSSTPLMVSRTLKYFEDKLTHFIRISKSALINPIYVDRVIRTDDGSISLLLRNGSVVIPSRRRAASTLARLER